ncbi:MAG: DNA polymerase III subunit [Bacilli bacterium]|nr:DNA polymerase III subunit [Bacilli bacterium]
MNCLNYLQTYQIVPYKIFYNALKEGKIFHAYLFVGELGTPLLDVAKYIAANIILNDNEPFNIKNESAFNRIISNNFGDLIILDTKENPVKIDDIRNLEDRFSKTSSEAFGKKVYIINQVENLGIDSTNALLKFLEEPNEDTYGILITDNPNALLPTIKSRVQTINFSKINQEILIEKAVNLGSNLENAELLSFFYNDENSIIEAQKDRNFLQIQELAIETLSKISSYDELMNHLYNNVIKVIKDKITARMYFDFLIIFFKEALKYKYNKDTILKNYDNILKDLAEIDSLENSILAFMNSRNEISYNLNLNLLIIHTFESVFGEIK